MSRPVRRGKIKLSFDEDEEEPTVQPAVDGSLGSSDQSSMVSIRSKSHAKPASSRFTVNDFEGEKFDFRQVKDRVLQMEIGEEIVLDRESLEAVDDGDFEDDVELKKKIQEAKAARSASKKKLLTADDEETFTTDSLAYDEPMTKADYWLQRDTKEAEEDFEANQHSRLVRENLFDDREDQHDSVSSYTQFMGKAGDRQGIMMTSRMLQRDMKSSLYDDSIDLAAEARDSAADDHEQAEGDWERQQLLKGVEKGWQTGKDHFDETGFISKQAKLQPFSPPKQLLYIHDFTAALTFDSSLLQQAESNLSKIQQDSNMALWNLEQLRASIETLKVNDSDLRDFESFFRRHSQFLAEKLPELQAIEAQIQISSEDSFEVVKDIWEHFFDDIEDEEFINLPSILQKYKLLSNRFRINHHNDSEFIESLVELFVRYHFAFFKRLGDVETVEEIAEKSGLLAALTSANIENPLVFISKVANVEGHKEPAPAEQVKPKIVLPETLSDADLKFMHSEQAKYAIIDDKEEGKEANVVGHPIPAAAYTRFVLSYLSLTDNINKFSGTIDYLMNGPEMLKESTNEADARLEKPKSQTSASASETEDEGQNEETNDDEVGDEDEDNELEIIHSQDSDDETKKGNDVTSSFLVVDADPTKN